MGKRASANALNVVVILSIIVFLSGVSSIVTNALEYRTISLILVGTFTCSIIALISFFYGYGTVVIVGEKRP